MRGWRRVEQNPQGVEFVRDGGVLFIIRPVRLSADFVAFLDQLPMLCDGSIDRIVYRCGGYGPADLLNGLADAAMADVRW